MRRKLQGAYFAFVVATGFYLPALAQQAQTSSAESERTAAQHAAQSAMQRGPQDIALRDQAMLQLPQDYGFIPTKEAARLMRSVGNPVDDQFIGLIMPLNGKHFIVTVDYRNEGYVKDDDATQLDATKLLDTLKDGTEAGNKDREAMGIPAIQVTRWIETPSYDKAVHHLVWSAEVKLKNQDDPDPSVNYNTRILGREGYLSLNLITATSTINNDKQDSAVLLAATQFNNGKRYSDFNSSTDKVAEYGLAALIGGLALKKLGLIAVLGGLLVKFKAVLIAVVAFLGSMWKRFRGQKVEAPSASHTRSTPQLPAPVDENKPQS